MAPQLTGCCVQIFITLPAWLLRLLRYHDAMSAHVHAAVCHAPGFRPWRFGMTRAGSAIRLSPRSPIDCLAFSRAFLQALQHGQLPVCWWTDSCMLVLQLLVQNFNAAAAEGVMCRDTVNVSWDGRVYDCDFNQQLEMGIRYSCPPRTCSSQTGQVQAQHAGGVPKTAGVYTQY